MSDRLLKIERCGQCEHITAFPYLNHGYWHQCDKTLERVDPNHNPPDWCPLPLAKDAADPLAMILVRTIVSEWRRTGKWDVDPDLRELLIELAGNTATLANTAKGGK